MFQRKLRAASFAALATITALTLTTGAASAVTSNPQPDDTSGTPVAADLIGVGSDTSQHAIKLAADAYDSKVPAPATKIFTYAACATPTTCGTVTLPSGDINRPNGSGGGKGLLYGAGNNTDIDFARSSSANSDAETAAGLQMFPFAVDTLVMAVSGTVTSHAPASLTPLDVVHIYDGTVTNWSTLGGTAGVIKPKIPQSGSGTRNFFEAQLKAANGGTAVVLAGSVAEVQEHDPAPIQNDPDVIAPFSKGRAAIAGTLRVETGGFSFNRGLYNVVRSGDVTNGAVTAFMGPDGFLCSPAATASIEAAGFRQLSRATAGGVCGGNTQTAITNFTTSIVPTTTTVTVTSASATSARVVARISAGSAPSGRVTFFEGAAQIAANVPLTSGQATVTPAATPGTHTYRAVFTPGANSSFQGSEGTGSGTVQKASSTTAADFPSKVVKGKKVKGTITVKLNGSSSVATGTVTIKRGSKTVGTGSLANGKVKIKLKGLKVGKNKLTASWAGDANGNASSVNFKVKITKKPKN